MHNHAPKNYVCPLCLAAQGVENEQTMVRPSDVVYKDEFVTAFISSFFIGNNPGHVVLIPNQHFENLYDLPNNYVSKIAVLAKKIAIALKEIYKCDGISTSQHNEPVGGQHAFHYHLHVFPRYEGDNLYTHMTEKRITTAPERKPYADKLRTYLADKRQ